MRPVGPVLAVSLLLAGCSGPTPAPTQAAPVPSPGAPAVTGISLCCGSMQIDINTQRQVEVDATYSDGSTKDVTSAVTSWTSSNPAIATVSSTGLVSGLAPGAVRISATYAGRETSSGYSVIQSAFRPPAADEVTGFVREVTPLWTIDLARADVEVIGGEANGRLVQTNGGGIFRISGLRSAGFDLIVRMRGYASTRVHVAELGRELAVNLSAAPGVVSEILQGDVCYPTRTISRVFRPAAPGFLRITGATLTTSRAIYADGALLIDRIFNNQDVELKAGVRYELRQTGSCDADPSGTLLMSLLRPVE